MRPPVATVLEGKSPRRYVPSRCHVVEEWQGPPYTWTWSAVRRWSPAAPTAMPDPISSRGSRSRHGDCLSFRSRRDGRFRDRGPLSVHRSLDQSSRRNSCRCRIGARSSSVANCRASLGTRVALCAALSFARALFGSCYGSRTFVWSTPTMASTTHGATSPTEGLERRSPSVLDMVWDKGRRCTDIWTEETRNNALS